VICSVEGAAAAAARVLADRERHRHGAAFQLQRESCGVSSFVIELQCPAPWQLGTSRKRQLCDISKLAV